MSLTGYILLCGFGHWPSCPSGRRNPPLLSNPHAKPPGTQRDTMLLSFICFFKSCYLGDLCGSARGYVLFLSPSSTPRGYSSISSTVSVHRSVVHRSGLKPGFCYVLFPRMPDGQGISACPGAVRPAVWARDFARPPQKLCFEGWMLRIYFSEMPKKLLNFSWQSGFNCLISYKILPGRGYLCSIVVAFYYKMDIFNRHKLPSIKKEVMMSEKT